MPLHLLTVALFLCLHLTRSHAFLDQLFGVASASSAHSSSQSTTQKEPPSSPPYPDLQSPDLDALTSLPDDLFSLTSPLHTQALSLGQQQLSSLSPSSHPVCSTAASLAVLYPLCQRLSDESKMRIAIGLTNCHLARARLQFYPCGESDDVVACSAVIGRDAVAYNTYTQFFVHSDNVCLHVMRQHAQEATMAVISSLFSATISTAQQLHSLQHDTQALSAALLSSFTSNYHNLSSFLDALAANESSHYSDISSRAERIHSSQEETLTSLHSQSRQLEGVIAGVNAVGQELLSQQTELGDAQRDMSRMQAEHRGELAEAKQQLGALHAEQREAAAAALEALSSLRSLHRSLASAQNETRAVLDGLTSDVSDGFGDALSSLASLSTQQREAFAASEQSLASLVEAQVGLQRLQEEVKGGVVGVREEVERLRAEELEGFVRTGDHLSRLESQAVKAETALRGVLDSVHGKVERILALDLSMLGELLKLGSIAFYLALASAAFVITATERTGAARLYVYAAMMGALMLERLLATRGVEGTEGSRGYTTLIRVGLCTLCGLITLLSAAFHRDYSSLSYRLQQKNAQLLEQSQQRLQTIERLLHGDAGGAAIPPPYSEWEEGEEGAGLNKAELTGEDGEGLAPFVMDERQRLITQFFHSPHQQDGEATEKRQSRRTLHEQGKAEGGAAVRAASSSRRRVSDGGQAARSRSRKSRKTLSSLC